jgi:hypothetical protein
MNPGIAIAVAIVYLFPATAQAYLDPGSGSFFFQILIGVIFSIFLSLRMAWGRLVSGVKGLLAFLFRKSPDKLG